MMRVDAYGTIMCAVLPAIAVLADTLGSFSNTQLVYSGISSIIQLQLDHIHVWRRPCIILPYEYHAVPCLPHNILPILLTNTSYLPSFPPTLVQHSWDSSSCWIIFLSLVIWLLYPPTQRKQLRSCCPLLSLLLLMVCWVDWHSCLVLVDCLWWCGFDGCWCWRGIIFVEPLL